MARRIAQTRHVGYSSRFIVACRRRIWLAEDTGFKAKRPEARLCALQA